MASIRIIVCLLCVFSELASSLVIKNYDYSDSSDQSLESAPLCSSRKVVINPDDLIKTLLDKTWKFDEKLNQKIEVDVCENAGKPCNDYSFVKTKCRQKYLKIQLQVVSRDNKKMTKLETFSIPSNCECVFYRH